MPAYREAPDGTRLVIVSSLGRLPRPSTNRRQVPESSVDALSLSASRDFRAQNRELVCAPMPFPSFAAEDALRLAALDVRSYVVDHLSVHRDIALAMIVKIGSTANDDGHELLVPAEFDGTTWKQVDSFTNRETIDCQFGGGSLWKAGRELTYRIPGVVTLKTTVSPHGNWSFVYSDPHGRKVMGASVVEGDFGPPAGGR